MIIKNKRVPCPLAVWTLAMASRSSQVHHVDLQHRKKINSVSMRQWKTPSEVPLTPESPPSNSTNLSMVKLLKLPKMPQLLMSERTLQKAARSARSKRSPMKMPMHHLLLSQERRYWSFHPPRRSSSPRKSLYLSQVSTSSPHLLKMPVLPQMILLTLIASSLLCLRNLPTVPLWLPHHLPMIKSSTQMPNFRRLKRRAHAL